MSEPCLSLLREYVAACNTFDDELGHMRRLSEITRRAEAYLGATFARYRCRECGRSHRAKDTGPVLDLRCCVLDPTGLFEETRHDRLPDGEPD